MGSSSQRPYVPKAAMGDEGSTPNLAAGDIAREEWTW
jgi:hypothetical protein